MKSILAIGAVGLLCVSGTALAGENCWYGKQQAALANVQKAPLESEQARDMDDPRVLADAQRRESVEALPPIHN